MAVGAVAVVGAGIMGLWSSALLLKQGYDVTIYEQYELYNTKGSSGGLYRSWRQAPEDWLMNESHALWRWFEEEVGESLLLSCGEHHPDVYPASESGLIYARRTLEALVSYIESHGGVIHPHTRVTNVTDEAVFFNDTFAPASTVVLTTGSDPLFHADETEVQHFEILTARLEANVDPYAWYRLDGCYGQVADGTVEVKLMRPTSEGRELNVDATDIETYRDQLVQCMRSQNLNVRDNVTFRPCKFTMRSFNPWENVLPRRRGRLIHAYGFNGVGFKYSPLVGRNVVEMVDTCEAGAGFTSCQCGGLRR